MCPAPWEIDAEGNPIHGWDAFARWKEFMVRELEDKLPPEYDVPPILDVIDGMQEAYLYNLMTRLARGVFRRNLP